MADIINLEGTLRTEFGKGAARRIRATKQVLATVYSGGTEPVYLQLPMKETGNAVRRKNALFHLQFGKETKTAVVKDIQRNPVKQIIEHIDFYEVKAGEKIEVEVPIFVEGETKGSGVAFVNIQQITVNADVSNLPESFTLSVEGLQEGDSILAKDIKLPKGAELVDSDPDEVIVSVQVPEDATETTAVPESESTEETVGEEALDTATDEGKTDEEKK